MGISKTINRKFQIIKNFFSKKYNIRNKRIIITGANSGIGFELTKKLSSNNNFILAFVSNNDENVKNIKNENIKIIKCDFKDITKLENLDNEIKNFKPNILINCAAKFGPQNQSLDEVRIADFVDIFNINALAPFLLVKKSLVSNSLEQIINLSSEMGSVNLNNSGNYYLYRSSKSILNFFSKNLSIDLRNQNINVFCIHPGDVKTKMNTGGLISADLASQKIINISSENNSFFCGKFIDIYCKILEW